MVLHLLLSALVAAVAPDSARAAPVPADSIVLLPEVRVERDRPLSDARRRAPTAFVTTIDVDLRARALRSLPELLVEAAGVHVQQYGGLGAFSTVSVRGAPPNQVTLYLDGVPLTSAAASTVSLGDLPVTAIDRIEIYRGPSPLALGPGSPGGAVNLVTMPDATDPRARLRLVRGSFDTWEGAGTWSGALGPLAAVVHGGVQSSTGDFLFDDDNGTPFNAADDSLSARVNNAFDAWALLGGIGTRAGSPLRLQLRQQLFRKRQGVPGLGVAPALHTRLELERSTTQAEVGGGGAGHWPAARVLGSLTESRTRFDDPLAELGLGAHDTDDRFSARGVDLGLEWARLPLGFALESGGSLRREEASLADAADAAPDPPASRRDLEGARVGLGWSGFGERVLLRAGRRWDRLDDHLRWTGTGAIPRASDTGRVLDAPQLGARIQAGSGLELSANWSKAERAPDFLELFGNQGSVLGNPALQPERGESWDAGARWTSPRDASFSGTISFAHFESRTEDLILYVRSSPSSVRAMNVARARVRGQEIEASAAGPLGFSASAAVTLQEAIDRGPVPFWNGMRLPEHPASEVVARLDWSHRGVDAGVSLHHLGDNYLDRVNRQRVARRDLLGASLGWRPTPRAPRLLIEGRNLTDDRAADVGGFPLPGRSVFVSLEAHTGP